MKEFVVFDGNGKEIDWIDPYEWHRDVTSHSKGIAFGERNYQVSNHSHVYEVVVPRGGHFELREFDDEECLGPPRYVLDLDESEPDPEYTPEMAKADAEFAGTLGTPEEDFVAYVGEQLAQWDDGKGDMAHDVLYRIQSVYERYHGDLPEVDE